MFGASRLLSYFPAFMTSELLLVLGEKDTRTFGHMVAALAAAQPEPRAVTIDAHISKASQLVEPPAGKIDALQLRLIGGASGSPIR